LQSFKVFLAPYKIRKVRFAEIINRNNSLLPVACNTTTQTVYTTALTCSTPASTTTALTGSIPTSTAIALTNVTVPTPNEVISLKFDCQPSSTYRTGFGEVFTLRCGINLVGGSFAKDGWIIKDRVGIVAYTIFDCMEACSQYNRFNGRNTCQAVTFNAALGRAYASQGANCWLKNATGPSPGTVDDAASAQIIGL